MVVQQSASYSSPLVLFYITISICHYDTHTQVVKADGKKKAGDDEQTAGT